MSDFPIDSLLVKDDDFSFDGLMEASKRHKTSDKENSRLPNHIHGEDFLRGPIPLSWLRRAAEPLEKDGETDFSAFVMGIVLWTLSGMNHRNRTVKVSNRVCEHARLNRHTKTRALKSLEKKGLINIEQIGGRSPVVTILYERKRNEKINTTRLVDVH